jgi:hypothetical protein
VKSSVLPSSSKPTMECSVTPLLTSTIVGIIHMRRRSHRNGARSAFTFKKRVCGKRPAQGSASPHHAAEPGRTKTTHLDVLH